MSRCVKLILMAAAAFSMPVLAQRTSILMLSVGAECALSVISSTHSDIVSDGQESQYTGEITFVYQIRTSTNAAGGNIQLQLVDRAALPRGGSFSYTTDLAGAGTAISGTHALLSSSTAAIIATFEPGHSSLKPGTGVINWKLSGADLAVNNARSPTPQLDITCR
jgi:hypothetical protein